MKTNTLLASLLLVASSSAFAEGFYVGGDLGAASYSNVTVPAAGGFAAATFPNPGMFRIAGGYHFNKMLAVEIDYAKFGDSTLSYAGVGDVTLAMHSLQAAAVGTYPLSSSFDLIGKLGLSANSASLSGTGAFATGGPSTSKTDLLIGIGAQYNINSQFSIRTQYESFGAFDGSSSPIKASVFSLGTIYNF